MQDIRQLSLDNVICWAYSQCQFSEWLVRQRAHRVVLFLIYDLGDVLAWNPFDLLTAMLLVRRFPHEKGQSVRIQFCVRSDISRFVHRIGPASAACPVLQDEALLLQEHVMLQEGKSRLLQRQTCQGRMLLQERHVPNAAAHLSRSDQ